MRGTVLGLAVVLALMFASDAGAKGGHHGDGGCVWASYPLVESACGLAGYVSPGYESNTALQLSSPAFTLGGFEEYSQYDWGQQSFTLAGLTELATEYKFSLGSCWGGSPRFQLNLYQPGAISYDVMYIYLGPPPAYTGCELGVWQNTDNLVAPAALVDDSNLPGGSQADTFANAVAHYGDYEVNKLFLGMDGGWVGAQTAQFDNVQINARTYTLEN